MHVFDVLLNSLLCFSQLGAYLRSKLVRPRIAYYWDFSCSVYMVSWEDIAIYLVGWLMKYRKNNSERGAIHSRSCLKLIWKSAFRIVINIDRIKILCSKYRRLKFDQVSWTLKFVPFNLCIPLIRSLMWHTYGFVQVVLDHSSVVEVSSLHWLFFLDSSFLNIAQLLRCGNCKSFQL